jgi:hypothetical protein
MKLSHPCLSIGNVLHRLAHSNAGLGSCQSLIFALRVGALEVGENVRVAILNDMGVTADEVASAFDGLGDNVRMAVYREFSNAYVPQQPTADQADLETFAGLGAGRILVPEWGDDAGRC